MLKYIAVSIVVLFLRVCGRRVDKKKISDYNRYHNRHSNKARRTYVERNVPEGKKTPVGVVAARSSGERRVPRRVVSKNIELYSKHGKAVRVNGTVSGRRYYYA